MHTIFLWKKKKTGGTKKNVNNNKNGHQPGDSRELAEIVLEREKRHQNTHKPTDSCGCYHHTRLQGRYKDVGETRTPLVDAHDTAQDASRRQYAYNIITVFGWLIKNVFYWVVIKRKRVVKPVQKFVNKKKTGWLRKT